MGLRKARPYSGCSRKMYCDHEPTPRVIGLAPSVVDAVQRIALWRPFYGTRQIPVMLSRELGRPVNDPKVEPILDSLE